MTLVRASAANEDADLIANVTEGVRGVLPEQSNGREAEENNQCQPYCVFDGSRPRLVPQKCKDLLAHRFHR